MRVYAPSSNPRIPVKQQWIEMTLSAAKEQGLTEGGNTAGLAGAVVQHCVALLLISGLCRTFPFKPGVEQSCSRWAL